MSSAVVPSQVPGFKVRVGDAWILTGIVVLIDSAWLTFGAWSVAWSGVVVIASAVAAFLAPLALGRYRRDLRLRTTLRGAALLITFQAAGSTLSYLVVSTNAALVDAQLAAWDHTLGFDWLALHGWLQDHPWEQIVLRLAYGSGLVQLVFVILFLGFTSQAKRLEEFMRLFVIVTLVVVLVSGAFPAAGAWKHYGIGNAFDLSSLSHFELLRNGRMREIPLGQMQGLISIPSLHAAMAVLFIYAMRRSIFLPVFVVLDLAMLASTPIDGGHYLVDVLAGVVLAIGLIALDRQRGLRPSSRRAPPASSRGPVPEWRF